MKGPAALLALWTGLLGSAFDAAAQQTLYGGNEWLQFESVNTGYLVTVNTENGAVTLIGRPEGVYRIVRHRRPRLLRPNFPGPMPQ